MSDETWIDRMMDRGCRIREATTYENDLMEKLQKRIEQSGYTAYGLRFDFVASIDAYDAFVLFRSADKGRTTTITIPHAVFENCGDEAIVDLLWLNAGHAQKVSRS